MMNKKITRKEFLFSILSITTLLFVGKIPSIVKSISTKKEGNVYGNYSYGGKKNT